MGVTPITDKVDAMPLHHAVQFRFNEGVATEAIDEMAARLRALPGLIPQIANYALGRDLGINDDNWDFALSADFASVADFETYRSHPEHQAVVRDHVEVITAERHAVQFEY